MSKYNSDRGGFELNDGNLMRIQDKNDDGNVRISLYEGDERGIHVRTTVNFDSNTGTGTIDTHNEDKSEKSSTDVSCFLTTACIEEMQENFDDDCYELTVLRKFRDTFVTIEDKKHYYEVAPKIVEAINNEKYKNVIYKYIYDNVIKYCVEKIKNEQYEEAYSRYKISILCFEERYLEPTLGNKLQKTI